MANSPLLMVDQYVRGLKSMRAITLDIGNQDPFVGTNTQLAESIDGWTLRTRSRSMMATTATGFASVSNPRDASPPSPGPRPEPPGQFPSLLPIQC